MAPGHCGSDIRKGSTFWHDVPSELNCQWNSVRLPVVCMPHLLGMAYSRETVWDPAGEGGGGGGWNASPNGVL